MAAPNDDAEALMHNRQSTRRDPRQWSKAKTAARGVARAAAAALIVAALGACGEDEEQAETQPAPAVTTFEQGRFGDVPLFPRSEPIGPRSEKREVVARSYRARGTTPEGVLEYYRDALDQQRWTMLGPIKQIGVGSYRAEWASGDRRLRVSATRAPGFDSEAPSEQALVQYSLSLRPK